MSDFEHINYLSQRRVTTMEERDDNLAEKPGCGLAPGGL